MTLAIESSRALVQYRFSTFELIPLAAAIVFYYALPDYLPLGNAVCITAIFALSLDLVIGYAGIVTLGHSVFFGIGAYTAALLSRSGWGEPVSIVIAGAVLSAFFALLSGPLLLRLRGLPLIMVTLGVASVVSEAANKLSWLTGGNDGLPGLTFDPVFKMLLGRSTERPPIYTRWRGCSSYWSWRAWSYPPALALRCRASGKTSFVCA